MDGVADPRWNDACFVLGPHRSGTTVLTTSLASSGAFVYLTAADIVACHWGTDQVEPTLGRMVERRETRVIDGTTLSEDLFEEYGFLLPGHRLTEETAERFVSLHLELVEKSGRAGRFLLKNPWDLTRTALIHGLFPRAVFILTVRDPVFLINSQVQAGRKLYGAPSLYQALLDPRYRRLVEHRRLFPLYGYVFSRRILVDLLLRSFRRSTDRLIRDLRELPRERWTVVKYEDLVDEPVKELTRVYGFLGLPPTGIPALAKNIRPSGRSLDPHVRARIPKIRKRTRLFRQTFGY